MQILGPAPKLDPVQRAIFGMYHLRRSQTHPDRAIDVSDVDDSIVRRHLLAMDRVFLEDRNEEKQKALDKARSQAAKRGEVKEIEGVK